MQQVGRVLALLFIFVVTTVAWFGLSAMMTARAEQQESELSGAVEELWGSPLEQNAPVLLFAPSRSPTGSGTWCSTRTARW